MEISVTFRHMEPVPEIKSYAKEKIYKVKKYFDAPVEANIVLEVEKFRHIVDMTLSVDGSKIKAVDESEDMYSSIDGAIDKLEQQLRRLVSRKREFKWENIKDRELIDSQPGEQERLDELGPRVIKKEVMDVKPMDVDEASMQIELSNKNFLVFTNPKSKSINVIYKRKDGNLGLIETSVK